MNISSAANAPLTSGVNNKPNPLIKNSARSAEPVAKVALDQSSNKQAQASIVIDEQAIALYEQSQALQSAQSTSPTESSKESFSFEKSSASQDQPSAKNETAVASYQAVGNLAQRESVQQLFGVDLFA